MSGHGRKRAPWFRLLYKDLQEELERLRSVCAKFNTSLLLVHSKTLAAEANAGFFHHRHHTINGTPIEEQLTIQ